MNRRAWLLPLVLIVLFLLCAGGVIGYAIGHSAAPIAAAVSEEGGGDQGVHAVRYNEQQQDSVRRGIEASRRNAITHAVASASPAVVGINVIEVQQYRQVSPWDDPFFRYFFGDRTVTRQVQELGSGFIVSPDGYILTNDHVAGNAKEITITLTGGRKYKADLVGTDRVSDVALLKIDGENLPYLRLGNSDDVITGEWAIALGNPFGLFEFNDKPTVTVGVVSAVGINLQEQEGRSYRGMIQTDAAINSGNSGGPLINSLGDVIGVNAVIFTPNQGNIGLGFAIPINKVKSIMETLKRSGRVERNFWTGLEVQTVDRRIARYFGLERAEGVIVADVQKNSPADRAGFRVGDIILAANSEAVSDDSSLLGIISEARVGDVVTMRVVRERKELTLKLHLERRPS
jgi:serine protease Do